MYESIWCGEGGILIGEKRIRQKSGVGELRKIIWKKNHAARMYQGPELKRERYVFGNRVSSVFEPLMNLQTSSLVMGLI